jgi:hypothetical protein
LYEMGLSPEQVRCTTYKEFNLLLTGYYRRQEQEWNRTRHLMAFIMNYGGMGSTEYIRPEDLYPLQMDRENEKRMITTAAQAAELLREFERLNGKAGI